jgi:hypothetical protein
LKVDLNDARMFLVASYDVPAAINPSCHAAFLEDKEVLSVARAAEDPMPLAKRARDTECKNDDSNDDNEDDSGDDDDDSGDDDI